mgnify:CR=1 FL=1
MSVGAFIQWAGEIGSETAGWDPSAQGKMVGPWLDWNLVDYALAREESSNRYAARERRLRRLINLQGDRPPRKSDSAAAAAGIDVNEGG